MINVEQTIISQYGNSATITQLVRNMDQYIDPRADINSFYSFVWNVDTAQGFGLDIWGRIVGISRELQITPSLDYFGFTEAGASAHSFNESPFYAGPPGTTTYTLADDAYRQLILVKALANISASNARAINQLLQNMFSTRGRCYVNDLGGMALRYTFEFQLTDYEIAIVTNSGAFPRPAGVLATALTSVFPCFGFAEAGVESAAPFNQAPFISEGSTYAIV